jgi:osmotically-inducible protein OsmY
MGRPKQLYAWILAAILATGLPGCAAYRTCGFSGCAGDAKITADVRAQFDQHPALEAPNSIAVQTIDQVVYLHGLVDTDLERSMADAVALDTPGVVRVVNSIAIINR